MTIKQYILHLAELTKKTCIKFNIPTTLSDKYLKELKERIEDGK